MSLAKKCDVCGKFYEDYTINNENKAVNAFVLVCTDEEDRWSNSDDATDCCPNCMKTIIHCIDGLKNGVGNESKVTLEKDITEPYIEENCNSCAFKHLSRERPPCDSCFEYDNWKSR